MKPWRGRDGLWVWVALGGLGTGLLATLDPEAYRHVLMPTLLAFAILGPISLYRMAAQMTMSRSTQMKATLGICCGLLALQFLPLVYPIGGLLPRARASEARSLFVADLQKLRGPVLVPYHGFYSTLAGKPSSLHIIPYDDLLRAPGNRVLAEKDFFDRMFRPIAAGLDRPAIVTDVKLDAQSKMWKRVDGAYDFERDLGWISEPLRPVTGNAFTPSYVYKPRLTDADRREARERWVAYLAAKALEDSLRVAGVVPVAAEVIAVNPAASPVPLTSEQRRDFERRVSSNTR
jgi:hypothetical protein